MVLAPSTISRLLHGQLPSEPHASKQKNAGEDEGIYKGFDPSVLETRRRRRASTREVGFMEPKEEPFKEEPLNFDG